MVFESLLADFINKYVGEYFENIDVSDLKLWIWNGYVELNNLSIKQTILDDLYLPLSVKLGRIDKLILKIPWKNLYKEPSYIELDTLYLLIVPDKGTIFDLSKIAKANQYKKQRVIDNFESIGLAEESNTKDNFFTKLLAHIIRNLEIRVKSIHIKYEDSGEFNNNRPMTIGCTLAHYSVTTYNWETQHPSTVNLEDMVYKVIKVEGLALYCDSSSKLFTRENPRYIYSQFQMSTPTVLRNAVKDNKYILYPVNITANVKINRKPVDLDAMITTPKICVEVIAKRLVFRITTIQYSNVTTMIDSMKRLLKIVPYHKYRPKIDGYKNYYKEWWMFAYTCILEIHVREMRNSWKWSSIHKRIKSLKMYNDVYKKKIKFPKSINSLKPILDECERQLDAFTIITIRQKVNNEIKNENAITLTPKIISYSPGYKRWKTSTDAIDSGNSKSKNYSLVKTMISVNIENIKIKFSNSSYKDLLVLDTVNLIIKMYLLNRRKEFKITMDHIMLFYFVKNSVYSEWFKTKDDDKNIKCNIKVYDESNFQNLKKSRISFECNLTNIQCICVYSILGSLLNIYQQLKDDWGSLFESNSQDISNISANSSFPLIINISIQLEFTEILFPINIKNTHGIMLEIHSLNLKNVFYEIENEIELPIMIEDISADIINLSISRVTFKTSKPTETHSVIVLPISFTINFKQNLSYDWFLNISKFDVTANFSSIKISIDKTDYITIYDTIENIFNSEISGYQYNNADQKLTEMNYKTEKPQLNDDTKSSILYSFKLRINNVKIRTHSNILRNYKLRKRAMVHVVFINIYMKYIIQYNGLIYMSLFLHEIDIKNSDVNNDKNLLRFNKKSELIDNIERNILEISYEVNNTLTCFDIQVSSSILAVNLNFIQQLFLFSSEPSETYDSAKETNSEVKDLLSLSLVGRIQDSSDEKSNPKTTMINVLLEKLDIYLIEDIEEENNNAILINFEIVFKSYLTSNCDKCITGVVKNFAVNFCHYHPKVLQQDIIQLFWRPTSLNFSGLSSRDNCCKFDICVSEVLISLNPENTNLLIKLKDLFENLDSIENIRNNPILDLWIPKQINPQEFWFLNDGTGNLNTIQYKQDVLKNNKDKYSIMIPSIIVSVEKNVSKRMVPVIMIVSSFQGLFKTRGSDMCLKGKLTFVLSYYNKKTIKWEPFIEPKKLFAYPKLKYEPWSVDIKIENYNSIKEQLNDDGVKKQTTNMKISLISYDKMEITLTKTSIEDISDLFDQFTNADIIDKTVGKHTKFIPFTIKNNLGINFKILFKESSLELFETKNSGYEPFELKNGASVNLTRNLKIDDMFIIGRKHLFGECNLIIRFEDTKDNSNFVIDLNKTSKRYFGSMNLYTPSLQPWSLICDTVLVGGHMEVTLRSVVQIHNHLWCNIAVYNRHNFMTQMDLINYIKPNQVLNLTVESIYTESKEFYFGVDKYFICSEPFNWADVNLKDVTKLIECLPSTSHKNSYFIKMVGTRENVHFEETNNYKEGCNCINISVYPTYMFINELPITVECLLDGYAKPKSLFPGKYVHLSLPKDEHGIMNLSFKYSKRLWKHQCEIEIFNDNFIICPFTSEKNKVIEIINLGIHNQNTNGGCIIRTLYCPIWMMNKTGKYLEYKTFERFEQIIKHPKDYYGPMMFSYRRQGIFTKKLAYIKIEDSYWSMPISLDVNGSTLVICENGGLTFKVAVHIAMTNSSLTKVVTFTPFFVLKNYCSFDLEVRENCIEGKWNTITSGNCLAFWPFNNFADKEKTIIVRITGSEWSSLPIFYTKAHSTVVNLKHLKNNIVHVDVKVTDGGIFPSFTDSNIQIVPAMIINHTNSCIEFIEYNLMTLPEKLTVLPPYHKVSITFFNPIEKEKKIMWNKLKNWADVSQDGFGVFEDVNGGLVNWVSFMDQKRRILLFTSRKKVVHYCRLSNNIHTFNQEISFLFDFIGISLINDEINDEILYVTVQSSSAVWEVKKPKSKRYKPLKLTQINSIESLFIKYQKNKTIGKSTPLVKIDELNMEVDFKKSMLMTPYQRMIRRKYTAGLLFSMHSSSLKVSTNITMYKVQIDNQLKDSIHPVIFGPSPTPKSLKSREIKPFIEIRLLEKLNHSSTIREFKYFKVFVQETSLKLDLIFIGALLRITEDKTQNGKNEDEVLFNNHLKSLQEPLQLFITPLANEVQKHFYNLIHFSPVKLKITFSLFNDNQNNNSNISKYFGVLMYSIGVTLTSVQDIEINLSQFERNNRYLSQTNILENLKHHYTNQIVKNMYVYVLGLDVIGNPIAFLTGISKGMADLIREPFLGLTSGFFEFIFGLNYGLQSFLNGTIGGTAGVLERITGAMSKGVATIVFNKTYNKNRDNLLAQKQSIVKIGQLFAMDILYAIKNCVNQPVNGLKNNGIRGCLIGFSLGVGGIVVLPIPGILDMSCYSMRFIKTVFNNSPTSKRVRFSRFINNKHEVFPYCKEAAEGYNMLKDIRKKLFNNENDIYVYHRRLKSNSSSNIFFVTNKRIALISKDIFGFYKLKWMNEWHQLRGYPVAVSNGLYVQISLKKTGFMNYFKSANVGKLIMIPDEIHIQWLASEIKKLMRTDTNAFTEVSYNWKI